ncbi:MAG: tRNA (adenosine(37)-N6)-dimethylallyltransferase MiaA [Myxococcota bacterium]
MSGPLLVIVGPTAAGKTAAAIAVCERVGGEIVSADSVQVYRGLNIGSAKPTAEERARVPHHCLDLIDLDMRLDAAGWSAHADQAIEDIRSRGKVPIICGGTGLYVRALLHGLIPIPEIPEEVRSTVRKEVASRGAEVMHEELAQVDPEAAERIAPRDRQRIGRALEVWRTTGRALSAWQADHRFAETRYDAKVVGLWPEREVLYERIDRRVDAMLTSGWFDEVEGLLGDGVSPEAPGLQTMGYRDVTACIRGTQEATEVAERIARTHRRYARRQLVWFRGVTTREDALTHYPPDTAGLIDALVALLA